MKASYSGHISTFVVTSYSQNRVPITSLPAYLAILNPASINRNRDISTVCQNRAPISQSPCVPSDTDS